MTIDSALYYPYINFRDERWLKQALLYWDKLWRIAPSGAAAYDPPSYWPTQGQDMQILEGSGAVTSVDPAAGGHSAAVAALWGAFLARHGDEVERRYRLDLDARPLLDPQDAATRGYVQSPNRSLAGVGWLLGMKAGEPLRDLLCAHRLAVDGASVGAPGWLAVDERVLDVYMTSLANAIIGEKRVETIADAPEHFRRFKANSIDALRDALLAPAASAAPPEPAPPGAADLAMALAVQTVAPEGLAHMPMPEVIRLRGDLAGPRPAFKAALKDFAAEIGELYAASPGGIFHPADLDALRRKHIEKPLAEIRRVINANWGEAAWSFVTLKSELDGSLLEKAIKEGMPASGAAALHPILAIAGVALGAFRIRASLRRAQQQARAEPLAYLLQIQSAAQDAEAALREAALVPASAQARFIL